MALFGIGKKENEKEEKTPTRGRGETKADTKEKKEETVSEKKSTPSANTKQKSKSSEKKKEKLATQKKALPTGRDISGILLRPRITEKATFASEKGVYVFEVSLRSTKRTIIEAIERFYKVTPAKVNIVKIPAKVRISKWRKARGVKPGGKKAYVHLKKGDSIEIV